MCPPRTPRPVLDLGPCPSAKQKPARRRQGGALATVNSFLALCAATLGGRDRPRCSLPARPRSRPGGSHARRRCADLLG